MELLILYTASFLSLAKHKCTYSAKPSTSLNKFDCVANTCSHRGGVFNVRVVCDSGKMDFRNCCLLLSILSVVSQTINPEQSTLNDQQIALNSAENLRDSSLSIRSSLMWICGFAFVPRMSFGSL